MHRFIPHLSSTVAIVLISLFISIPSIHGSAIRAECSESYAPCTCTQDGVYVSVTCTGVQPDEIKQVFSTTTYPVLKEVDIVLPADAGQLPADILNRKVAEIIKIRGAGRDTFKLIADIGAFTPSRNKTKRFDISDADISELNFGFLDSFAYLENLYLTRVSGVRVIKDIRLLQSLAGLYIDGCVGFTEFAEFPNGNFPILRVLHVVNNEDLTDDKLSIILIALDAYSARDTLNELWMDNNQLTRVPLRLPNFVNLAKVSIKQNTVGYLQVNSVGSGAAKCTYFNIQNNQLDNIEPGAFVGDYSAAKMYLDTNNLKFFYEQVYKPLLESMAAANQGGLLSVTQNPFVCDCTIAWLIARNPNLLQFIDNQAKCDSGKLFTELDKNAYALCP